MVVSRRRPRGETRREILALAARLLQTRGYHGFSFHHLAEGLGVRTPAVHYHFPTKADLAAAVLRRFRDDFAWWREQPTLRALPAHAQMEAFLDLEARYVAEGKVCPLGMAGVEFASLPPAACREAQALMHELRDWLAARLAAAREQGQCTFAGSAEDTALAVMAAAQGGLQLARLNGADDFAAVRRALRTALGGDPSAP
ncbi:TetR/AcrR family transcriptional regulator [Spiribacter halobius]|uniref:TetR/AcrR family transcriptional regulator n=1 Tax=Sediminicurvatus halobius TaxID=2182432 RepID=A0A2U2MWN5_9GAMM|nr:TetR/AcrR family transcriptional regulator [Spiribacter halobius]PWG61270.1 TetR/AcrR family transcriptional regulator [Spiribacter halobius]UEX78421.1 TetR/AcrR family transcriptional regulator [Spiribacter halobius]